MRAGGPRLGGTLLIASLLTVLALAVALNAGAEAGASPVAHSSAVSSAVSAVSTALNATVAAHRLGYLGKDAPYARTVGPHVIYIKVNGVIDSAMEDYVKDAVREAEKENVPLVILLNTPGGYLDNAFDIARAINGSSVPVIGYVNEGWALSAGTLILVCTHVAAMAPGTQIGSMQPVLYNPTTGSYEPVNESKIINPILEFLDDYAASKGRNATQLYGFVLHNDNLDAEKALKYHVIEFVAPSLDSLLREVNGSVVGVSTGNVKLMLDGSAYYYPPGVRVEVLHVLSDPILSGLLLTLGMLIILFTFAAGHVALASIGALLLILGLAGSGFNPNYTALILIMLGSLLLFVEIHTPGFGVVGGTGIVMLLLGVALLPVGAKGFSVSPAYARDVLITLYSIGGVLGAFTAFAVYKIVRVRKKPPALWSIIGARGEALDDISEDKEGFVFVEGEYWKARSISGPIKAGEEVIVVDKDGPTLLVRRAEGSEFENAQGSS